MQVEVVYSELSGISHLDHFVCGLAFTAFAQYLMYGGINIKLSAGWWSEDVNLFYKIASF
jgi:hypothetical protein